MFGAASAAGLSSATSSSPSLFSTAASSTSLFGASSSNTSQLSTGSVSLAQGIAPNSTSQLSTVASSGVVATTSSELQGRSVGTILKQWRDELGQCMNDFQQEAKKLETWDRHILQNRREITQLSQDALRVSGLQDKLLKKLDLLEQQHSDIFKTLREAEDEAGHLFDDEQSSRDSVETKRINLYSRAVSLSEQLNQMAQDLAECIHSLNQNRAAQTKNGDPAAFIERTLDNQLNALNDINRKCASAEKQMQSLGVIL